MKWKFCLVFCALSLLSLPAFAESKTESVEVPSLEPEVEYILKGKDITALYQTINDLNESKNEYRKLTLETLQIAEESKALALEYEKENQKLTSQNKFLIGTTVCSVGICVVGVVVWACTTGFH